MPNRARLDDAGQRLRRSPRARDAGGRPTRGEPDGPQRTCVGCRRRDDRSRLLRVVAVRRDDSPGRVVDLVPDPRARLPGRGAWLHPDLNCLDLAVRRRAFARALRVQGPVELTAVRHHLAQAASETAPPAPPAPLTPSRFGSGSDSDGHPMSIQQ